MTNEFTTTHRLKEIFGEKLVLTIPEVAQILRLNSKNLYQMIKDNRFPMSVIRVGKNLRVSVAEVAKYLDQPIIQQDEIAPTEVQHRSKRRRKNPPVENLSHLFK